MLTLLLRHKGKHQLPVQRFIRSLFHKRNSKPEPRSMEMWQNQRLDHLKVFLLFLFLWIIHLWAKFGLSSSIHHLYLSPVEGSKRLSKSGGDDTNSEQYKKDNQTLLLQVCIRNFLKSHFKMLLKNVVACVHLCFKWIQSNVSPQCCVSLVVYKEHLKWVSSNTVLVSWWQEVCVMIDWLVFLGGGTAGTAGRADTPG